MLEAPARGEVGSESFLLGLRDSPVCQVLIPVCARCRLALALSFALPCPIFQPISLLPVLKAWPCFSQLPSCPLPHHGYTAL